VLEALVRRRNRRRLAVAGWLAALDAAPGRWAARGTDPTAGNAVDVLVDGAAALPAIAAAIRSATDHVHLGFWALEHDFALVRDDDHMTLRQLLAEAAERVDVRLLLWGGAPVPVIRPWARDARRALRDVCAGTRVHGALDSTRRWSAACHEKVVVVDGREAFVGGIDPTTLQGDRFDRSGHPDAGRSGWHDVTARLRGPAVADVAAHFADRWRASTGEHLAPAPPPPPAGSSRVQILRTEPARGRRRPGVADFSGLQGHVAALRGARKLIYLESQYLRSVEVLGLLADKLRDPPSADFRVVAVLPHNPQGGYDATHGQLRLLEQADAGSGRFLACSLRTAAPGRRRPVYVHAKVVVVDDEWLSIGSLNLSGHALFNAVEVQLATDDARLARTTRERLWSEHLGLAQAVVSASPPHEVVDRHWRPAADRQLERERAGVPLDARVVRQVAGPPRQRALGALQTLLLGG